MHNKLFVAVALLTLSMPATVAAEKPPLPLQQSSAWNVDYADDRCRLMRKFGTGKDEAYAIFDRYGPTDRFRMTLAGRPFKTIVENGEATVRFGPTEAEQKLKFYRGTLGDMPALVFRSQIRVAPPSVAEQTVIDNAKNGVWIELAPVGPERERAIKSLSVGKPLRQTVVLETGPLQKPFEALAKCVDDLMTTWGIDVERHKTLSQSVRPLTSPGEWIVSRDYPLKMLSAGQPAIVEFRLSVGADGKPASCHIQSTTRPKDFDAAVCESLMRRARFAPALDAGGEPIASYYRNTVNFALPQ
jgi:Gram-negative bacterial TonB protein C-terminal